MKIINDKMDKILIIGLIILAIVTFIMPIVSASPEIPTVDFRMGTTINNLIVPNITTTDQITKTTGMWYIRETVTSIIDQLRNLIITLRSDLIAGNITFSSLRVEDRTILAERSGNVTIGGGCIPIFCPTGLVNYWTFDDGNGTIARDSLERNNGTLMNGTNWTVGQVGRALNFDGVNDHVEIRNISTPTSQITIGTWINTRSTTLWQGIIEHGSPALTGWHVFVRGGNRLHTNLGGEQMLTPINSITLNTWHHVMVTWNGTVVKAYIDGIERNRTAITSIFPVGDRVYIGIRRGFELPFNGLIDEVVIFNRALNATEVQHMYNQSLGGRGYCGNQTFEMICNDNSFNTIHGNLNITRNLTVGTLAGTGNAFACIDPNGRFFRSSVACV